VINSIGIFNSQWSGHLVVLIIIRDRIRADPLWGRRSGNANVLRVDSVELEGLEIRLHGNTE
jgi:hypothetical protein